MPENAQTYGEMIHFPAAIYQYAVGWFDNDVTKLFSIHPKDEAERLVALIGGRDAVVAAAADALERNEFAWAAQVIQYAYLLDPQDTEVRQLKADALRAMGHLTAPVASHAPSCCPRLGRWRARWTSHACSRRPPKRSQPRRRCSWITSACGSTRG